MNSKKAFVLFLATKVEKTFIIANAGSPKAK